MPATISGLGVETWPSIYGPEDLSERGITEETSPGDMQLLDLGNLLALDDCWAIKRLIGLI